MEATGPERANVQRRKGKVSKQLIEKCFEIREAYPNMKQREITAMVNGYGFPISESTVSRIFRGDFDYILRGEPAPSARGRGESAEQSKAVPQVDLSGIEDRIERLSGCLERLEAAVDRIAMLVEAHLEIVATMPDKDGRRDIFESVADRDWKESANDHDGEDQDAQ